MDSKLEHSGFKAMPTDAKALSRLEAIYQSFNDIGKQASQCAQTVCAIDDSAIQQEIAPGVIMVTLNEKPNFKGLVMCPHCAERGAMLLRDLANVFEDLAKEAIKHK